MTQNTFVHISEVKENLLGKLRRLHNARTTRKKCEQAGSSEWAVRYWNLVERSIRKQIDYENRG